MRPSTMRLAALANFLLILISFILWAIALLAGRDRGKLENYALTRTNLSMLPETILKLGLNELSGGAIGGNKSDNIGHSIEEQSSMQQEELTAHINDITSQNTVEARQLPSAVQDFLSDLEKNFTSIFTRGVGPVLQDAATEAKRRFHIPDWDSLHVLSTCAGSYKPNATAPHPRLNSWHCTRAVRNRFNFDSILNLKISLGGKTINVGEFKVVKAVVHEFDKINSNMYELVILMSIAFAFIVLGFLVTAALITLPGSKILLILACILTDVAAIIAIGAAVGATVRIRESTDALNRATEQFNVITTKSGKFMAIIWAPTSLLILAGIISTALAGLAWPREKQRVGYSTDNGRHVKYSSDVPQVQHAN